jgi:hypothetical protein
VGARSVTQFVGQRVEPSAGAAFAPARVLAAVEENALLDEQEPGAVACGTVVRDTTARFSPSYRAEL